MKAKDLREKTTEELKQKQLALKEELFNLRYQAHTGRLEKPSQINSIRKDIARINTILKQKQTSEQASV
ncbi:50S ribosomal protein L29 [Candidatus Omnitrophota bacterium]